MTAAFLSVFIDVSAMAISLPIVPFVVLHLGGKIEFAGIVFGIYAATGAIFTPCVGSLSDRVGRKSMLLLLLFGSAGGLLISGLADTLVVYAIGRAVAGMFSGSVPLVQAHIADAVTSKPALARGYSLLNAILLLGFSVGPLIGGFIATIHVQLPFTVMAVFATFTGLLASIFFTNIPRSSRNEAREVAKRPHGHVDSVFFFTYFMCGSQEIAQFCWPVLVPLVYMQRLGWGTAELGAYNMIVCICGIPVQLCLLPVLLKRVDIHSIWIAGTICQGLGNALNTILFFDAGEAALVNSTAAILWESRWAPPTGLPTFIVGNAMHFFGCCLLTPIYPTLIAAILPPNRLGLGLGIADSLRTIVRAVGPALWTASYVAFGHQQALPLGISAALNFVYVPITVYLKRRAAKRCSSRANIEWSDSASS